MNLEEFTKEMDEKESAQQSEELYWLFEEVEKIKPHVIMEIGNYKGGTLWMFQHLLKQSSDMLIGMDTARLSFRWDPQSIPAQWFDCSDPEDTKIKEMKWSSQDPIVLKKIEKILNGRKIDFLFIDGDHSYKNTLSDYVMYSPLVRDGGLIGFHDLCMGGDERQRAAGEFSVKRFWEELDHKKYAHYSDHGPLAYGIGFIIKGEHNTTINSGKGIKLYS